MKTAETLYQLAITMDSKFEQYLNTTFSENQYFLIISEICILRNNNGETLEFEDFEVKGR